MGPHPHPPPFLANRISKSDALLLTLLFFLSWQAQIKLEAFGFAVADATSALELDPNYVKVSRHCEDNPSPRRQEPGDRKWGVGDISFIFC